MSIQFSYYRNIHASHMILTPALEGEPWEKEMLWRNRPRELILPEYNSRNGQTQLWYDITGKQAVDMLAELSDISYEIFIKICEAVVAMAEVLDGLLISPDILLLRPESIFFDNQTENVSFCCYFGNEKEIGKSFHELLEYLLAKLDHKNVNGVQTAYELFEYTRMDGYCIAEIKKILNIQRMYQKKLQRRCGRKKSLSICRFLWKIRKKGSCVCGSKKSRTYLEGSVNYYKGEKYRRKKWSHLYLNRNQKLTCTSRIQLFYLLIYPKRNMEY